MAEQYEPTKHLIESTRAIANIRISTVRRKDRCSREDVDAVASKPFVCRGSRHPRGKSPEDYMKV